MSTVTERILQFNKSRDPQTILLKYDAMQKSSFSFFRGTCHLFYEDLNQNNTLPSSPLTWLCGDLHLENAGSFKGSDREVYFDLNDFDEAASGPALWDVARLLTSIIVARNDAADRTVSSDALLTQLINSYRQTLQKGKPITIEQDTATGLVKELFEKVALRKEKALVKEKTDIVTGYTKLLIDDKKIFALPSSSKKELSKALQTWLNEKHGRNARMVSDVASVVAGTGSIGVKRYLALVNKTATAKNYLLIIKQALPSSLQPYTPAQQPAWQNEAERICDIQYRMQHVTPGDLSMLNFKDEWYVTKWMQPVADKVNMNDFNMEKDKQAGLMNTFGQLTASAQLRSSGRQGSAIADDLIKFGNDTAWVNQLLEFVKQYAVTVKKDYTEYLKSYNKGYFNFKD